MKGILRYTDNKNVDLLGFIIDKKKVYARPYTDIKQLNSLLDLAKKENKTILSY
jgi:hypothetical protein